MKHKWTYFIDASTTNTGITMLRDDNKKLIVTSINFSKYKANKKLSKAECHVEKFHHIKTILDDFTKKYPPMKTIYMEGIFVKPAFLNSSEVLLKFHGFLIGYFIDYNIVYYPPKTIKKLITGNGNANKEDIRKVLEMKYQIDFNNYDESDSLAVFEYYRIINNCLYNKNNLNIKII